MTSDNTALDPGLDDLLNRHFPGKVVRKDLTKLVKEGANVPVYVLEYLLGSYCASNDETVIEEGLRTVKKVLAENYVRPDEAEKVKSTIRERGSLKVIDKVTVTLNEKRDVYEALLGNLGVKGIEVPSTIVKKFEKLLIGGIWSLVTLEYFFEEAQKGSPFVLRDLKPIQMPKDLCGRRFAVEVSGMAPPLKETARCHFQFTAAMDVDHVMRRSVEPIRGGPGVRGHPWQTPE